MAAPLLRPGAQVVRRDAARLAIVLGRHHLLVPDTPAVRTALEAWQTGCPVDDASAEVSQAREVLRRADWLLDRDAWPQPVEDLLTPDALATHGSAAPGRVAARRQVTVGLDLPPRWQQDAERALALAGLTIGPGTGDVLLLAASPAPDHASWERLMRDGTPHLWLVADHERVRLGPFVDPGRCACLRCVEVSLAERDATGGFLAAQQRPEMETPVVEPSLLALAWHWAARDLAQWAEGGRPASWSATVDIGCDLQVVREEWRRHPHCGCAWDELTA